MRASGADVINVVTTRVDRSGRAVELGTGTLRVSYLIYVSYLTYGESVLT
jgi:hypothetical protein